MEIPETQRALVRLDLTNYQLLRPLHLPLRLLHQSSLGRVLAAARRASDSQTPTPIDLHPHPSPLLRLPLPVSADGRAASLLFPQLRLTRKGHQQHNHLLRSLCPRGSIVRFLHWLIFRDLVFCSSEQQQQ